MRTPAEKWVVACEDYVLGPYRSKERAEKGLAAIRERSSCTNEHQVLLATPELLRRAR